METNKIRIKDILCPQCRKAFQLIWNEYSANGGYEGAEQSLFIRSCPSGGVYDVSVVCPHCKYEEDL